GDPDALYFYPKAAVAYNLHKLPRHFDQIKLRFAYGETGNQPTYGMKFTPLDPTHNTQGNPGIGVVGDAGDPKIKPERQREFEGGADMVAWNGRGVLELTFYQRNISDMILRSVPAPSTGYVHDFFNGGELRNRGVELMVEATPVRTT